VSYSWFQTSWTVGQWYSDTSPFSIPWCTLLCTDLGCLISTLDVIFCFLVQWRAVLQDPSASLFAHRRWHQCGIERLEGDRHTYAVPMWWCRKNVIKPFFLRQLCSKWIRYSVCVCVCVCQLKPFLPGLILASKALTYGSMQTDILRAPRHSA